MTPVPVAPSKSTSGARRRDVANRSRYKTNTTAGRETIKCPQCAADFLKKDFTKHLRCHEKNYKCPWCELRTGYLSNIKIHLSIHHLDEPATSQADLPWEKMLCPICGGDGDWVVSFRLAKHMREGHEAKVVKWSDEEDEKMRDLLVRDLPLTQVYDELQAGGWAQGKTTTWFRCLEIISWRDLQWSEGEETLLQMPGANYHKYNEAGYKKKRGTVDTYLRELRTKKATWIREASRMKGFGIQDEKFRRRMEAIFSNV